MIRGLWIYLRARLRMIGRCPPHRYEKDGQQFPFCLDCGKYRDDVTDVSPPNREGVERGGPPTEVTVRICPWCGSEPLADTNYCDECDKVRDDWLNVRYLRAEE